LNVLAERAYPDGLSNDASLSGLPESMASIEFEGHGIGM
jgi:hypothetical protein